MCLRSQSVQVARTVSGCKSLGMKLVLHQKAEKKKPRKRRNDTRPRDTW